MQVTSRRWAGPLAALAVALTLVATLPGLGYSKPGTLWTEDPLEVSAKTVPAPAAGRPRPSCTPTSSPRLRPRSSTGSRAGASPTS